MAAGIFDGLTVVHESCEGGGWQARLRLEPSSRAFSGHFEGTPILPGIAHLVILRHALRAIAGPAARLIQVPAVRFRRIVGPGDVLDVTLAAPDADGRCRFDVRVGDALAVTGIAVLAGRVGDTR